MLPRITQSIAGGRFLRILFIFSLALVVGSIANALNCKNTALAQNRPGFTYEIGTRHVTVIGWDHPTTVRLSAREKEFFQLVAKDADHQDCEGVAADLSSYLDHMGRDREAPYQQVVDLINQQPSVNAVAMEFITKEVNNLVDRAQELRTILARIQNACPGDAQTWNATKLMLFGPELVQNRPEVSMISLESDSAMSDTDTLLAQMKPYERDLGPQTQVISDTLNQRFAQGLPLFDEAVVATLSARVPVSLQGELTDYFQLYAEFLKSTHERDIAIAQNLVSKPGNIVLVIG
jgi:hypothetical protein